MSCLPFFLLASSTRSFLEKPFSMFVEFNWICLTNEVRTLNTGRKSNAFFQWTLRFCFPRGKQRCQWKSKKKGLSELCRVGENAIHSPYSLDTRKFHLETVFLTLGLGWGESTVSPRQKETKHSPYMLNACACKDTCATAVMINALSLLFWMLKILPERGPSPAGTISTSFLDAAFFFSFCFPTFFHQTSITEAPLLSHYTQTLSLSFSFLLVFCSYFKMRHLSLLHF